MCLYFNQILKHKPKEPSLWFATQKQDKKIREKFLSETHQSYNLVNRQCAQVVQKALNAAGIETNSSEMSYYDDMFLPDSTPYLPARTFIAIRYNNPKGIYIRKK